MKNIFKRLSFPIKLMLIGIIPLVLVIILAIQLQQEKKERIYVLDNLLEQIKKSTDIGKIINELQAERRLSFAYFFSKKWQNQLLLQRNKTDETIINRFKGQNKSNINFKGFSFLDSLQGIRKKIDNVQIEPGEINDYYTNCIFRLNTFVTTSNSEARYIESLNRQLSSSKLITEMITNLAMIKSNVYFELNKEINSTRFLGDIKYDYELFKSFATEFKLKSTPEADSIFTAISQSPEYIQTMDYLNNSFAEKKYLLIYNAEDWWNLTEKVTEKLKILQQGILQKVSEQTDNLSKTEEEEWLQNLIIIVFFIALVIIIVFYTISSISISLSDLGKAANMLAIGHTSITLEKKYSKDVIGDLARSISQLAFHNITLSKAAGEIGKGNFDVPVKPRSEFDEIGNAIVKMKNDLQKFNADNADVIWVQAGVTKVNSSTRGEKELKKLTADTLTSLVEYINAQTGLFYVVNGSGKLDFAAGYAVSNANNIIKEINLGENIIGQAALKKELIILENIPKDYSKISSASGDTAPTCIVLFPLVHDGFVEGVIEFALLRPITSNIKLMLTKLSDSIALSLHSCKSRMRLQELLEETQAQSEEMQAQHAELENMNAELEVQSEKLQGSEEELKVQQEELIQANHELAERSGMLEEKNRLIEENNKTIQKKAQELSQSTQYKSEFLANMSHELRTPLNSILLLSRLLSDNDEMNLTNEQVEFAKVILSSGNGLLNLIDEILDLSKIESGKMEMDFEPTGIGEIVDDLKSLFGPVAKEKKLELFFTLDENLPATIETDKLRLEQILKNFYSNALKFTKTGSISLHIYKSENTNKGISFSIKDTGIGIPPEKQLHIFEAFRQADGSTQRKYGGTGLGLSISRELTRLLGGQISLASELNKGSEFTVTIPISKDEIINTPTISEELQDIIENTFNNEINTPVETQAIDATEIIYPQAMPDDRDNILPGDKVILIIDDDIPFAKSLISLSHKNEYKAIAAIQGDEGLMLAEKYRPIGILLDIQLPVKDGWEVMEALKNNPLTKDIPIHTMSSNMEKGKSLLNGAVDFVNKPLSPEKVKGIFQKLEYVLHRNPKKVLIVEENEQHAKALAYYLETFNLRTGISNDLENGIHELLNGNTDCIILDMSKQDENAYRALEEVKKRTGLENLSIIIFTDKNLSRTEEQHIKQYADSIVVKSAHSYQRILDEVSLFMHVVEERKVKTENSASQKKLGNLTEVLKDKKVLIADDDVRNIFGLTKSLEKYKMKVITAMDGKEAIQEMENNEGIHVVLMDMMMPEMDGYEAMKEIRKIKKYKDLPIIAVTAKAMKGDREKCIKAGASDYITKPVDTDQLISLLRVWLYEK